MLLVVIEKGRRSWGAHVPDLPGCVAAATTRAAVVKLIQGAIEFHIQGLKEAGLMVPRPDCDCEVVRVSTA